jgi:hypothetical protein
MKYEIVTVSKYFKEGKQTFFVKATQEYISPVDMGHYKFVILAVPYGGCTTYDGDVVKSTSSCGAPPKGKMDEKWVGKLFDEFYREYKQYQKYLKKEKE